MNKHIKVFITGGTIDDIDNTRENVPAPHTYIPDLLNQSRVTVNYDMEILMLKDSREISADDRETILQKCQTVVEDMIVITHGTFTLADTAVYLGNAKLNKTIVLFGSIIPANKNMSDASFNLGAALIAVQLLDPNVYVVMNGEVFQWNNVKKDLSSETFTRIKY